jgi:glycosyltransferase involved in cell wall biosynthesis
MDATPRLHDQYARWYKKSFVPKSPTVQKIKQTPVRLVFQDAAHLLPFSQWAGDSLVRDYGINEKKITVIPPGLDLDFWSRARTGNMRRKHEGESTRILFVGGEFMRKGGDLLLRVAGREEFSQCEFHFVTQSFRGAIGKNVFVYDNLPANSEKLLDLYRTADIFALPTRSDFYSLVSLEAMAMNLPVVATPVGGIGEIIEEGKSGFLIPTDDEDALAHRLRTLAASEGMRRQFGEFGRRIVEERFDLRMNAERTVEFMKKAAQSSRGRYV